MKPYGVPRIKEAISPDVADGRHLAVKASAVNLPGKGGDIRSNFKNPQKKQAARRHWAKKARMAGKQEVTLLV